MSFVRRSRFRSDVRKAYRIVCEKGVIDDGELQYLLDLSHGPYYRVRKALLAIFPDVSHQNGYFRISDKEKPVRKGVPIDFWGDVEHSG